MKRERQPALSGTDVEHAFGQFVTGIVIVAASTDTAEVAVSRVQAFSSVSLDPALVLWSLAKRSENFPIFRRASRFVAHVLAQGQSVLAQQAAAMTESYFAGARDTAGKRAGHGGAVDGCCAWFECAGIGYLDGGDHGCFIAQIENFASNDTRPLIAYAGAFRFPDIHPDTHHVAVGGR